MPALSAKVDICEGHDACPPRPFSSWSPDCTAEGLAVTREEDTLAPHGCPKHAPHGAAVTRGYPTVTVNNRPVAHAGAPVSCASGAVSTGRPTVILGSTRPSPRPGRGA